MTRPKPKMVAAVVLVAMAATGCGGISIGGGPTKVTFPDGANVVVDEETEFASGFGADTLPPELVTAYEEYSGHEFPDDLPVIGWTIYDGPRGVDFVQVVAETTPERAAELAAREAEQFDTLAQDYRGQTDERIDEALARLPVAAYTQIDATGGSNADLYGDGDVITVVLTAMRM